VAVGRVGLGVALTSAVPEVAQSGPVAHPAGQRSRCGARDQVTGEDQDPARPHERRAGQQHRGGIAKAVAAGRGRISTWSLHS
jgi:hypothetical protein